MTPADDTRPATAPGRGAAGAALGLVLVPLGALTALLAGLARAPLPWSGSIPWVPGAGIELAFRVDGLSALMLVLITGVGTAVFVYANGYLAGDARRTKVVALLAAFLVAMVGCVTADDLVLLYLCWEATSLLSFLLIGSDPTDPSHRKAAQQALLVTGAGGLCLLGGFLLLAGSAGTHSLSEIVARGPELVGDPALPWAMGLVFIGCATKSAQFPFHFWLPNAMAAPTPVSAYLHSATMVKLGVYLLARLGAGFGSWTPWSAVLVPLGSFTAAWAMLLALRERDLKRILAWSTVGALGTLVLLIGLDGEGATVATATFLLAHAMYKAPLFFVAGNVDHGAGTRLIDRLGGLRRQMPFTAAAAALAGLSMAGLPLSFGFVAKDVIKAAKRETETLELLVSIAHSNMLVSALAVAVAGVAAVRIFWRHPGVNEACEAHEGNAAMVLPPLALALTGIVFGLAPGTVEPLIAAAARAMTPGSEGPAVALAPQLFALLESLAITLVAGAAIFWLWDPIHARLERLSLRGRLGATAQYERLLRGFLGLAARVTRTLQHGRLPAYAATIVAAAVAALVALAAWARPSAWPTWSAPDAGFTGAALLIAAGAVLVTWLRDRLALLLASGLVGYGSAILFLFAGAPDLAFTQFAVETVFVVVVASLLGRLHRLRPARGPREGFRPGAALLSAAFGLVLGGLLLAATGGPFDAVLGAGYSAEAPAAANGRNVVNVILVDFRGLDTLGEITVVALSFLAAVPLLLALRHEAARSAR